MHSSLHLVISPQRDMHTQDNLCVETVAPLVEKPQGQTRGRMSHQASVPVRSASQPMTSASSSLRLPGTIRATVKVGQVTGERQPYRTQ